MPLKVKCPECGQLNVFENELVDTKVKCLHGCGRSFRLRVKRDDAVARPAKLAPPSMADLKPGERFEGCYEIRRRLGRGSFGVVYHAFDEARHRDVALKIPFDTVQYDDHFMGRFTTEVEILHRLDHPHIVHFYLARLDEYPAYLVAEYIDGPNLEQVIEEARLEGKLVERSRALGFVADLAGALHHAHLQGVIHRDVKPANILLSRDRVKLADFGLARLGDPRRTQEGKAVGTPFYMAPEQVQGDQKLVTSQVDQYALGIVMFQLLVGRVPFIGSTSHEVFRKILDDPLPDPSELEPTISPELAAVCLRALSREPDDRYPDCAAFGRAVSAFLRPQSPAPAVSAPTAPAGPIDTFDDEKAAAPPPPPVAASRPTATEEGPGLPAVEIGEPSPAPTEEAPRTSPADLARPIGEALQNFGQVIKPIGENIGQAIKPIGENLGQAMKPIGEAVSPLGNSLKSSVSLSVSLVKSRAPGIFSGIIAFLQSWVERMNARLRGMQEAPPGGASPSASLRSWGDASVVAEGGGSFASRGEIPLASGSIAPRSSPPAASVDRGSILAAPGEDAAVLVYLRELNLAHESWLRHDRKAAAEHLARCPINERGWEWAYLQALNRSDFSALEPCDSPVHHVAFQPDQNVLATAGEGEARLWDLARGEARLSLEGRSQRIGSLAFSKDGRKLAAAGGRLVRLWDVVAGKPIDSWVQEKTTIRARFSPEGNHLAIAGVDPSLRVLDVRDGSVVATLGPHGGGVHSIAFRNDGRLAAGCGDGEVIVWDWTRSERLGGVVHGNGGGPVTEVAYSPDGRLLVSAGGDRRLRFWSSETHEPITESKAHDRPIQSMSFHPGGRWIATLSGGHAFQAHEALSDPSDPARLGRTAIRIDFAGPAFESFAFAPDGRIAFAGGTDRTARIWSPPDFWAALAAGEPPTCVTAVAIAPNGTRLAVARVDGSLSIRDLSGRAAPRIVSADSGSVPSLAFHPSGRFLAAGHEDGSILIRDLEANGRRFEPIQAHTGKVLGIAYGRDGRRLASSGSDGRVRVWDAETLSLVQEYPGHGDRDAHAVVFINAGRLVSAGADRLIKVWNEESGELIEELDDHGRPVTRLGVSSDGRRFTSVGLDRTLRIWDAETLAPLLRLERVDVLACVASPSADSTVAAGGEDRFPIVIPAR